MSTRGVCVYVWVGWMEPRKIKYKKEMSNTAQDRIFLSYNLTLEDLYEWTEPWLVCLFLFVFFFHPFCISLSFCFFFCLSLCPFVLKQLCGCAYIICNPAGQWEQERDGKKPFPLPINYYSLCPLFYFALSRAVLLPHPQRWWPAYRTERRVRKTQMSENNWGWEYGIKEANLNWNGKLRQKNTRINREKDEERGVYKVEESRERKKGEWMTAANTKLVVSDLDNLVMDTDSCLVTWWTCRTGGPSFFLHLHLLLLFLFSDVTLD